MGSPPRITGRFNPSSGAIEGDLYQSTDLTQSVFLSPHSILGPDGKPVAQAKFQPISGFLVGGFGARPRDVEVFGALNPEALLPFNPVLLPDVPFCSFRSWPTTDHVSFNWTISEEEEQLRTTRAAERRLRADGHGQLIDRFGTRPNALWRIVEPMQRAPDVGQVSSDKRKPNIQFDTYETLTKPIRDEDFPPDINPSLKASLKRYECHLDDQNLLRADPPHWHPWTCLCDWYGIHIERLKAYFQMLREVPASHVDRLRNKIVIQWFRRIEPYHVGIREHLHRIVAEDPKYTEHAHKMLAEITASPTTTWRGYELIREDWSRVDAAYATSRTFIESYYKTHHGRIPLGRPVPIYSPGVTEPVRWEWSWIPADDPKKQKDDDFKSGSWFKDHTSIPLDRLRHATSTKRRTKRVRKKIIDGVECYSVTDAKRWWPDEWKRA